MGAGVSAGAEGLVAFVEAARRQGRVPGLAVAVADGAGVRWSHGWGLADLAGAEPYRPDSVGHWFSMTKVVAVTAALQLVDEGRLDLRAPVGEYLGDRWSSAFAAVRVEHLASHSAGLPNPLPLRWTHPVGEPLPDQSDFLAHQLRRVRRPRFEPGTRAAYSNLSTVALGEVVAAVTGSTITDRIEATVLGPLGLDATGFTYTPERTARAAVGYQRLSRPLTPPLRRYLGDEVVGERVGHYLALRPFEMDAPACSGLIGPVTDAARFVALHLNDGVLDGVRILSPASCRAMRDVRLEGKPYDLGLGWFRPRRDRARSSGPDAYVEHFGGGGGFWNVLRLYPERGLGVAVMGNTTHRYDVGAIADAALRAFGPGPAAS